MLATMSQAEYQGWRQFWREEPWGSYRDNLHVAILAREIRRPQLKPGTPIDADDFMIRQPTARAADRVSGFIRMLFMASKPAGQTKRARPKRARESDHGR
jgi:hypothetical protein